MREWEWLNLVETAKQYAIEAHQKNGDTYNGLPYSYHLEQVVCIAKKYIEFVPKEDRNTVIAACWAHDVIEDTCETYQSCKRKLGTPVAELVYAVTNELGRNRKERNEKTYPKIRANKYAIFIKLADRYANLLYSLSNVVTSNEGFRKLEMYIDEMSEFEAALRTDDWVTMWNDLIELTKL